MIKKMSSSEQFQIWEDIQYRVWDKEISLSSIQKMIDEGLDVNCTEEKGAITPLFLFDSTGRLGRDVCRLLIRNGANPRYLTGSGGWSILTLMLSNDSNDPAYFDLDTIVFFLEHGIDPNQKNRYGNSSLAALIKTERNFVPEDIYKVRDIASVLLAYGAKVDKKILDGASERMRYVLTHEDESRKKGKKIIKPILVRLKKEERAFEKWLKNWEKIKPLRIAKKVDPSRQKVVSLLDSLNTQPATPLRKVAKEAAVKVWAKENPQKSGYMMRKGKKRQEIVSLLDALNKQPPTIIRKVAKKAAVKLYRLKNPKEH